MGKMNSLKKGLGGGSDERGGLDSPDVHSCEGE